MDYSFKEATGAIIAVLTGDKQLKVTTSTNPIKEADNWVVGVFLNGASVHTPSFFGKVPLTWRLEYTLDGYVKKEHENEEMADLIIDMTSRIINSIALLEPQKAFKGCRVMSLQNMFSQEGNESACVRVKLEVIYSSQEGFRQ